MKLTHVRDILSSAKSGICAATEVVCKIKLGIIEKIGFLLLYIMKGYYSYFSYFQSSYPVAKSISVPIVEFRQTCFPKKSNETLN